MMKRIITTSVVAGLLGTLGYAPVVSAEGTLYGSVRSGIIVTDDDGASSTLDLGSADAGDLGKSGDRLWSRIGVKASHDLGDGVMGGLHIEKRLDQFRTRHQNVWLSGAFGKVTLGQQGSPYHSAASWDGTNFMGGNHSFAPSGSSRIQGVSYASDLGGPFNVKALITDDNSGGDGHGDGVDKFELSGSLSMSGVNFNVGYADNGSSAFYGGTAGGSFGGLGWEVGFEAQDPEATGVENNKHAGFFLGYGMGDGSLYFYYEDLSGASDDTTWVTGYSHALGDGVKVIGEHKDQESSGTTSILAVVVGF